MRLLPTLPVVLLACFPFFLGSCSHVSNNGDAGVKDSGPDGDVDPCTAAAPHWKEIWSYSLEKTSLTGNTPNIDLMDVWGSAADDIYAVGFGGTILHYDGKVWTKMESGSDADLEGVWGYVLKDQLGNVTRTDVFAVGSNGTILRYNGTAWTPQLVINDPDPANPNPQPVTGAFHDVWGYPAAGPDPAQPTVIAVGGEGLIARWEATKGEFLEMRQQVSFTDHDGGVHITYQRWSPERLGGVFGTAVNNFVAVGNNGTVLQYDGTSWTRQAVTATGGGSAFLKHLNGVWGRSASEIFAVGIDGTVVRGNGSSWQQLALDLAPVYLRSIWDFGQTKCGDIIDGGTSDGGQPVRQDTSWVIFAGWSGTVLLAHDSIVCPIGDITLDRLEGMWGNPPRSEADRTDPDGGAVACDPVEVFIAGVNGTIVRLSNPHGQ